MMGPRQVEQGALFYNFSLDDHVPADHLLRSVDRFLDLAGLRRELAPYYSETGRPSVDPELMMRMLIIGYCLGIRSERRLCEAEQAVLINLILRGPDPAKGEPCAWTLPDLCRFIEERFDKSMCPQSMSRVVRRLGLSRQRPDPSTRRRTPRQLRP